MVANGTYIFTCKARTGKIFTFYSFTAGTADTYHNIDENKVATSTSPTEYIAKEDFWITDVCHTLTTGDDAGMTEFISNGRRTGVQISSIANVPTLNVRQFTNNPIPIAKGTNLRLLQTVANA